MSSVGGVGGAGGGCSGAAVSGASGAGAAGAASGGVEGAAGVQGVGDKGSSIKADDTKAVEMTGNGSGIELPQMSTQDFCALRTQAAQPVEESAGMDLQKMLEWLMAIKMLEAMNENGG